MKLSKILRMVCNSKQIETYNKTNFLQNDTNSSIIERFSKMLTWRKNEVVLDIGMGDGRFTAEGLLPKLPKDLKTLIGCEYVPWKVEFAKKSYPHPKLQFIELDIQTRNLEKEFHEKFDHIFSFFTLNWVHDLRQSVENMFVMMKPGSEFLVSIVEKGVDISFYNLSKNPKWAPYGHEKYISKFMHINDRLPAYRNLFQDMGFVNLNCFREYIVYGYKNRELCEEMFKSLNPIVLKIPKEDLDEYYADFVAELEKTGQISIEICPESRREICTTSCVAIIIHGKKPDTK